MVDLHTHTTASDGTYTPTQLIEYAVEKGIHTIAVTDHDTVAGLDEAMKAGEHKDIEVVPGIEFSTEYKGRDIHIVGLDIDYHNPSFVEKLAQFVDSRDIRNEKMCERLRDAGVEITMEELKQRFPEAVITRAHFASLMLEKGSIHNREDAFRKYIGDNGPCYVPREKVSPVQAIQLIKEARGIPVLAHPMLYRMQIDEMEKLSSYLAENGLVGIEGLYSTYNYADQTVVRYLAGKYGLVISGGSDFHGANKPYIDLGTGRGNLNVPDEVWENLKQHR